MEGGKEAKSQSSKCFDSQIIRCKLHPFLRILLIDARQLPSWIAPATLIKFSHTKTLI